MPENINRYMLQAIDPQVATSGSEAFVYTKMGRVVLVGFIAFKKPPHWQGTKIHVNHGSIGSQEYIMPDYFGRFFLERARRCEGFYTRISSRQAQQIARDYSNNRQRAMESETWAAMGQNVNPNVA